MLPTVPNDAPRQALREPAAVFHPIGAIRLITPAEAAARDARAPRGTPHPHVPASGAATTAAAPGEEA